MMPHKLLALLLTTLMTIVPTSGLIPNGDPPIEKEIHEEVTVEALGTSVTITLDSDVPPEAPIARGAPEAPRDLAARWDVDRVALRWAAPPAPAGAPVHAYRVYRAEREGAFVPVFETPDTSAIDLAVTPRHAYSYAVTALNADGESPRSAAAAILPALPPIAPHALDAAVDGASVHLTWAHDDVGSVVGYVLYVGAPGGPKQELARTAAPRFEDAIVPGAWKVYHVTALNEAGESAGSKDAVAHIAAPLSPPRDLVGVGRVGAVDLTWSAPLEPGEGALRYVVESYVGAKWETIGATNDTRFTHHVRNESATYRYHVIARDANGESAPSNEVSVTTPARPPQPPSEPRDLRATPGWGEIGLRWLAPVSGDGPMAYRVYVRDGTAWRLLAETRATGYNHTGLAGGETHAYVVRAVSHVAEGPASNEATARAFGAPSAPRDLHANGTQNAITLRWSAPADDGGMGIVSYRIYRGNASHDRTLYATVPANGSLSFVDKNVRPGHTLDYSVTAVNRAEGPHSNVASAAAYSTPGAPTNLTATRGAGHIDLSWVAPAQDGGSAILGYRVYELRPDGPRTQANDTAATRPVLVADLGAGARSWRHEGLGAGETHAYFVVARNAFGEGARSATVIGKTQSAPSAPQDVVAQVNVPSTAVRLSWSAPEDDGGAPITAYRIYRATASGGFVPLAQVDGSTFRYWDESCATGTMCQYLVTAVNRHGEGARSEVAQPIG